MIRLELVDKDNFEAVMQVQIAYEDQRRVASVEYSLAQAWLYRDTGRVIPYAVITGSEVVGFLLVSIEEDRQTYLIWRLLIDRRFQNRGYGKEALRCLIELAQSDSACQQVVASYVIGNHKMRYILEKLGFQSQGLMAQEVKMMLKLN